MCGHTLNAQDWGQGGLGHTNLCCYLCATAPDASGFGPHQPSRDHQEKAVNCKLELAQKANAIHDVYNGSGTGHYEDKNVCADHPVLLAMAKKHPLLIVEGELKSHGVTTYHDSSDEKAMTRPLKMMLRMGAHYQRLISEQPITLAQLYGGRVKPRTPAPGRPNSQPRVLPPANEVGADSAINADESRIEIWYDGGSRDNPGIAGAGALIYLIDGERKRLVRKHALFVGDEDRSYPWA